MIQSLFYPAKAYLIIKSALKKEYKHHLVLDNVI